MTPDFGRLAARALSLRGTVKAANAAAYIALAGLGALGAGGAGYGLYRALRPRTPAGGGPPTVAPEGPAADPPEAAPAPTSVPAARSTVLPRGWKPWRQEVRERLGAAAGRPVASAAGQALADFHRRFGVPLFSRPGQEAPRATPG